MAGPALLQVGRRLRKVSLQAQHFRTVVRRLRKVTHRDRRRSTFAQIECQGRVQILHGHVRISWQAQNFRKVGRKLRKVGCRLRGRRSTFLRSSAGFVPTSALSHGRAQIVLAGPGLLQGRAQIAQGACRGRHTFERSFKDCARSGVDFVVGAYFVVGATLLQGQAQISWHAQRFRRQSETHRHRIDR